jgi:hypothetical protein
VSSSCQLMSNAKARRKRVNKSAWRSHAQPLDRLSAATFQILPRADVNRSSRAASASARSTPQCHGGACSTPSGAPPSVGRMLLATIGDGGLTGHGPRALLRS